MPPRREGYAVATGDGSSIYWESCAPARLSGAPTVVLSDGIGCDGYVWKYLRAALAPRHTLLHWHYRGHGRSPAPRDRGRVAIADLADDLAAVLDDAGIDRAVLFGHSMGVQVSLETARRHRGRVLALGLFCGAAEHPLRTFRGKATLERMLPRVRTLIGRAPRLASRLTRAIVPTRLAYALAQQMEVNGLLLEERDFMPYLHGLSRVDPVLFLDMLAEAGRHSATDLLPELDVPLLVVAGSRDGFTPPELSAAMAAAAPRATLVMVDGGSHTAPLERPDFVNDAVLTFLAGLEARQQAVVTPA
jgi:pimeloyl-ACP methyl ester carboxylesterase